MLPPQPDPLSRSLGPSDPPCCEERLFELLDGTLDPASASAVRAHLETCAGCRRVVSDWRVLDRELARVAASAELSSGFRSRLARRIQAETTSFQPLTLEQRAQARADLQRAQAGWRRRFFRSQVPRLMDGLGLGVTAGLAGYALFLVARRFGLPQPETLLSGQWLVPAAVGFGAMIVLAGLAFAGKRHVRAWLSAI